MITTPQNKAKALAAFGWQVMRAGQHTAARDALSAAVLEDDSQAQYWAALGIAEAKCKSERRAIAAFEKSLSLDDKNIEVWCMLGEVKLDSLDYTGAHKALQRCVGLDPSGEHPAAIRARALLRRGQKLIKQALGVS